MALRKRRTPRGEGAKLVGRARLAAGLTYAIEALERRLLLSTVTWTGAAGDNLWTTKGNWNTGAVPGTADDVVISIPATTTITIPSGTQSIDSLTCSASLSLTGGELAVAAASNITGPLSVTGGTLLAAGTGATLQANGAGVVSNATLGAENGGELQLTQASGLTSVNLTVASGGQILFPVATSYATNGNTIQASGSASKIQLLDLATMTESGFGSGITASTGGEIDLAGQITGSNITLSDAASTLNVAAVTKLANLTVQAAGGTLNFAGATALSGVDLTASSGGQILFPVATSYATNGNTIQASGSASKVQLLDLATMTESGFGSGITASTGGEIDLAGQITGSNITLSDAASTLNVAAVTKLSNLTVSATGGTINFAGATALSGVDLTASSGGQILFPVATSYATNGNTIQASGSASKIQLLDLATMTESGFGSGITASTGGEIDLAGQITGSNITLSDAASTLNVAAVTKLANLTVQAAGGTLNFAGATALSGVDLTASSGGQILFPVATSYATNGNTIQASGSASKVQLLDLATMTESGFGSGITASTGGEIDLAGQITGSNITLSDAASTLNVAAVTKLSNLTVSATGGTINFAGATALSGVDLTASSGGQILFPVATSYATNGNTIQASGSASKIQLLDLATMTESGFGSGITASTGGEIDLAGQITGSNITLSDAASTLNVAAVTKLANLTVQAAGGTINFAGATALSGVDLTASSGGQILFPVATSYATNGNTIQASGSASKVQLLDLATMTESGFGSGITASTGGEIDLAGQITGSNITLSDAASTLNVAAVTKLSNLTVSATGGTINFAGATALSGVDLTASSGGQILFPVATSYATNGNTIQASGSASKIQLLDLATMTESGFGSGITASTGGEIDLAGQITGSNITLSDAASTLNVAAVTKLANLTVQAAGGTINFAGATALSGVDLTASSGGQILFPVATSYATNGNTIQASGSASKIQLLDLATMTESGFGSGITASTGGEIDLAGQITGSNITLSDAASTLNVAAVTKLSNLTVSATGGTINFAGATALSGVDLTAASGGKILFPVATSYATNGNTIQASGSASKIQLLDLATMTESGFGSGITASTGGEIDLAGQITGSNITLSDAASTLNVAAVTKLSNLTVSATGGTINFAGATALSGVNLTASSGGQIIFSAATTLASSNLTAGGTGGTVVFSGPVTLQANVTISLPGSTNVSFLGGVSGPYGLTLNGTGSGILTLGGSTSNTYTGPTTVLAGVLQLGTTGGATGISNILIITDATVMLTGSEQLPSDVAVYLNAPGSPATLDLNGYTQTVASLTVEATNFATTIALGGGTIIFNPTAGFTYNGAITGGPSSSIQNSSSFTVHLSGNTTEFNGGASVDSGTLSFDTPPGSLNGSTLPSGTTWAVMGGGAILSPQSPSIMTNQANVTLMGSPTSVPAFPAFTQGFMTNSAQGSFNVTGFSFSTAGGLSNSGTLTVGPGGMINVTGTVGNLAGGSTLTGGTWMIDAGATLNFPSGPLISTNQASVTLSGAGASFPALAGFTANSSQGSLTVIGGANFTATGTVANNGTLTFGASSTVSGSFSGTGTTSVSSGGSLMAGTFTQAMLVNDGSFSITGSGTIGTVSGSGDLTIGNGSTGAAVSVNSLSQNNVTVNNASTLTLARNATPAPAVLNGLTLNGTGTLDLSNNGFIFNYTGASPLTMVAMEIQSGRNGGAWTGTGITSSAAAANPSQDTIVYGEASALLPSGGTFMGQTIPAGTNAVLARVSSVAPSLVGRPVINGDNPNGLFNAAGEPTPGVQRSMVEDVVYTFNEAVTIPDANEAFTVVEAGQHPGTALASLSATAVPGSNGTQWAVTLTGAAPGSLGSIANGEYSITINPSGVFAASDGATQLAAGRTDQFYRLYGDINGDEVVNAADNLQLKKALTNYNPAFDSNADGTVNAADNLAFKKDLTVAYFGDGFVPTI